MTESKIVLGELGEETRTTSAAAREVCDRIAEALGLLGINPDEPSSLSALELADLGTCLLRFALSLQRLQRRMEDKGQAECFSRLHGPGGVVVSDRRYLSYADAVLKAADEFNQTLHLCSTGEFPKGAISVLDENRVATTWPHSARMLIGQLPDFDFLDIALQQEQFAVERMLNSHTQDSSSAPTVENANAKLGRRRRKKSDTTLAVYAAIGHKMKNPEWTESRCAAEASLTPSTLNGRAEWKEFCPKIEAAYGKSDMTKVKREYERRINDFTLEDPLAEDPSEQEFT